MEKETIEEIRNNMLIEISSWGGLGRTPGTISTIITNDKKIYYYRKYFLLKSRENKEELLGGSKISDESFNTIKTYIDEHYINKIFEPIRIFDASYTVRGPGFCVTNHLDEYNRIKELINKVK